MAGVLEGEGCFTTNLTNGVRQFRVQVSSADLDVLEKLKRLFDAPISGPYKTRAKHHAPLYRWGPNGKRARELMELVYPLMSKRRREQMDEAFANAARLVIGSMRKCAFPGCSREFVVKSSTHKYCGRH